VILLESVADPKDGTFFPAVLEIAAENLQDAEATHAMSLWWLSWRRKNKRERRDFECWMFNFSPHLRDTLARGLWMKEEKNGV